jgi:hypothetical protein
MNKKEQLVSSIKKREEQETGHKNVVYLFLFIKIYTKIRGQNYKFHAFLYLLILILCLTSHTHTHTHTDLYIYHLETIWFSLENKFCPPNQPPRSSEAQLPNLQRGPYPTGALISPNCHPCSCRLYTWVNSILAPINKFHIFLSTPLRLLLHSVYSLTN